ncbi:YveK family protein [Paenibacillus sp. SI8]|uniref:YveK family protein n=1 Tax=unclassified Paenibacillus TaxID=185978 RepID=UPI003465178D
MEIQRYFKVIWRRIWYVIIPALVVSLAVGYASYKVIKPTYQASIQILVNKSETDRDFLAVQTSLKLIDSYNVIIKNRLVLNQVIDNLSLNMSASDLASKISVGALDNSQVIQIKVNDSNMPLAVDIVNNVADVFKEEIHQLLRVDNVKILDPAKVPLKPEPIKPKPAINVIIGFFATVMFTCSCLLLLDMFDTRIKGEQEALETLGYPILARSAERNKRVKF